MARDKILVPMPESELYKKSKPRDDLVRRYGEATVSRAEVATVLNILYITRICSPSEFMDTMIHQCQRIEEERRLAAGLEADRG